MYYQHFLLLVGLLYVKFSCNIFTALEFKFPFDTTKFHKTMFRKLQN